jgi:hypothetical protein
MLGRQVTQVTGIELMETGVSHARARGIGHSGWG